VDNFDQLTDYQFLRKDCPAMI